MTATEFQLINLLCLVTPWSIDFYILIAEITCCFYFKSFMFYLIWISAKLSKNDLYSNYWKPQLFICILWASNLDKHFWWMFFWIEHDVGLQSPLQLSAKRDCDGISTPASIWWRYLPKYWLYIWIRKSHVSSHNGSCFFIFLLFFMFSIFILF